MVALKATSLVVMTLALAALAGCATTQRERLSNSAQNLEYNAAVLARDTGPEMARGRDETAEDSRDADDSRYADASYPREYARDARALARSAHELRVAVDEGADDRSVQSAFDRVSRNYHAVRDEVAHSDSIQAQRDFGPVTDSYRAIEHALGMHPRGDAYVPPA